VILKGKSKVMVSCRSGMTAGTLWLGLNLLGVIGVALWDEVNSFVPVASKCADGQIGRIVCGAGPGTDETQARTATGE